MRVYIGRQAAEMLKSVLEARSATPGVYDYELEDGAVLIRKRDKQCIYIKRSSERAIAIEGSPAEIDALGLIVPAEVEEAASWALKL